jgi:hypothetical protein
MHTLLALLSLLPGMVAWHVPRTAAAAPTTTSEAVTTIMPPTAIPIFPYPGSTLPSSSSCPAYFGSDLGTQYGIFQTIYRLCDTSTTTLSLYNIFPVSVASIDDVNYGYGDVTFVFPCQSFSDGTAQCSSAWQFPSIWVSTVSNSLLLSSFTGRGLETPFTWIFTTTEEPDCHTQDLTICTEDFQSLTTITGTSIYTNLWECTWGTPPIFVTMIYNISNNTVNGELVPVESTFTLSPAQATLMRVTVLGAEKLSFGSQGPGDVEERATWLPNIWIITPKNANETCPSSSSILGTFAVENLVFATLALVTSNAKVVHPVIRVVFNPILRFITCGKFGQDGPPQYGPSISWFFTWIITLGLQLASSTIIAVFITRDENVASSFTIGDLLLFFTTRPRSTWIFRAITLSTRWRKYYLSSAFSCIVAEFILHGLALYVMGRVVKSGKANDLDDPTEILDSSIPGPVRLLYPSALLYLIADILLFLAVVLFLLLDFLPRKLWWRESSYKHIKDDIYSFMGVCCFFFAIMWIANWLFWTGYVQYSGEL